MKALIVDDEPIARQILREALEGFPQMEIVGEAGTGVDALAVIHEREPDVVFLDLEMPDLDGFGVAKTLRREKLPLVVFVTAYDKHALEAFEAGAVDYLLKPIRQERLAAALDRVKAQLSGMKAAAARETAPAGITPRKIVGRLGSDQYLLDPAEVIAFVADGELVYIVTATQKYLANQPLRAIEERLTSETFRRIHRRTIINTNHIRKISPLSSKRWQLKMSNGIEVVVSKRMASVIRQEMRW